MYITINDVIGKKRIDLSYPIKGKDIAVVSMLSNNVVSVLVTGAFESTVEIRRRNNAE